MNRSEVEALAAEWERELRTRFKRVPNEASRAADAQLRQCHEQLLAVIARAMRVGDL